ncbi:MAG: glutaredoxin family protein [Bacillota bacterium]|jgi:glutaredoxin|uniref:glutaredoxin family protein n=1 Tax=Bacillus sp. RO2 TaxID=2723913 RepID=UPI001F0D2839|nr:glutaredoxin family protein [Bacillus sp. RO2]MEA3319692.1 glutaredoxin family protein [Bacillota bacterium]
MILFSMPGCHKCHAAKLFLKSLEVQFKEVDVLEKPEYVDIIKQKVGKLLLPVLVVEEKYLVQKEIFSLTITK